MDPEHLRGGQSHGGSELFILVTSNLNGHGGTGISTQGNTVQSLPPCNNSVFIHSHTDGKDISETG